MFEVKPVKQLEGNRTEIAVSQKINKKNTVTRHFSVPADKVDEFTADYKKQNRKSSALATIAMLGAAGLGGILGGKVIKKFFIGSILGGLAFGLGGFTLAARHLVKKDKAVLDKHNTQEVFYLKNEDTNLLKQVTKK
ncbi:hypothetical protein IJZ97_00460 [bacterium]|nr:hypothetical protein [bacterium]